MQGEIERRQREAIYYSDKKWCGLDLDKFSWRDYSRTMPSTHPYIQYLKFMSDVSERNRLQRVLTEIKKHNNFHAARSIHPCQESDLGGIVKDVTDRIKRVNDKIENFHRNYII